MFVRPFIYNFYFLRCILFIQSHASQLWLWSNLQLWNKKLLNQRVKYEVIKVEINYLWLIWKCSARMLNDIACLMPMHALQSWSWSWRLTSRRFTKLGEKEIYLFTKCLICHFLWGFSHVTFHFYLLSQFLSLSVNCFFYYKLQALCQFKKGVKE